MATDEFNGIIDEWLVFVRDRSFDSDPKSKIHEPSVQAIVAMGHGALSYIRDFTSEVVRAQTSGQPERGVAAIALSMPEVLARILGDDFPELDFVDPDTGFVSSRRVIEETNNWLVANAD